MSNSWGVVTTLKAPLRKVLNFAAWHLDLGATRLHLHFDDPADPALPLLAPHPKIRAVACDRRWWGRVKGFRPARHQVRQSVNATHCYRHKCRQDWLAHIDVDEFLLPEGPLAPMLAALPVDCHVARLWPMEALASDTPAPVVHFRTLPRGPKAQELAIRMTPEFGPWLTGGLLSHANGKIFARPGLDAEFRIHNLLAPQGRNPGQRPLPACRLAHFHAGPVEEWLQSFAFRLQQGSYRAGLRAAAEGAPTLHQRLTDLLAREGEPGLRRFHAALCADTEALRDRLRAHGALAERRMDFDALRRQYFPEITL